MTELIPKEFKGLNPFLRFQVRQWKERKASYPIYDKDGNIARYGDAKAYLANPHNPKNPDGETPTPENVNYWELLGYGASWSAAVKMAKERVMAG